MNRRAFITLLGGAAAWQTRVQDRMQLVGMPLSPAADRSRSELVIVFQEEL